MRFPKVLPRRTIATVEIMLSTSFCAVPAFRRVEPAMTSGPTTTSIGWSTAAERGAGVAGQADRQRAALGGPAHRAEDVRGATAAAIPTTASSRRQAQLSISAAPAAASSSAPSCALNSASARRPSRR